LGLGTPYIIRAQGGTVPPPTTTRVFISQKVKPRQNSKKIC